MIGTVEKYHRALCWGFVTGEDGRRYFVHRSEILGPALQAGDRVEFNTTHLPRGPRAVGVRKLTEAAR